MEPKVIGLYVGLLGMIGVFNAAAWLYATGRPAFLTSPVGPRVRLVVAAILAFSPPLTTGLGVASPLVGHGLLGLLIPVAAAMPALARRWAVRADTAHLAEAPSHG